MAVQSATHALQTSSLVLQLRALEQLTQSEIQIARIRIAQARTDAVRRELSENGDNAVGRAERIAGALRTLDAIPDVVTPALGRVLAFVKSTVEQAQPVDEALIGDLALEHQLLDRARYVRELAESLGFRDVATLADDLVTAHTATVDWLTTVLAEVAIGGPAALVATPLQKIVGGVTKIAGIPARFAVNRVNRAVDTVARTSDSARSLVADTTAKAFRFGDDTRAVAVAGRDAALARTEQLADRDGADRIASAAHQARTDLGVLAASELPIPHYEELTTPNAISAIRRLEDAADLRGVIAFEEQHKNRAGVVSAAQTRAAALAKDAARI